MVGTHRTGSITLAMSSGPFEETIDADNFGSTSVPWLLASSPSASNLTDADRSSSLAVFMVQAKELDS